MEFKININEKDLLNNINKNKNMLKYWNIMLTDHGFKTERENYTILMILEEIGGIMVILTSALNFFFEIYNYREHRIKIMQEKELIDAREKKLNEIKIKENSQQKKN